MDVPTSLKRKEISIAQRGTIGGSEVEGIEEEERNEEKNEDDATQRNCQEKENDEYEVAFQPHQSTQRGTIIRNATRHAYSSGGGSS
ncbi:hypothetical protein PVK06_012607 [Gossypium arboreum]|uniref:Uncharacterized protein n=1 Tax=Gossypium arboreum TaxID=29729 RepID=A0ABR0QC92_GOSAR|nr:hypothetical protein PVK06_012607 [Gossypium arboreum]